MRRYFIFDCNRELVGNPAGYASMNAATRLCSSHKVRGSLMSRLWDTYEHSKLTGLLPDSKCTVWSVESRPVDASFIREA